MLRFPFRQVFGDPDNAQGMQFYDLRQIRRDRGACPKWHDEVRQEPGGARAVKAPKTRAAKPPEARATAARATKPLLEPAQARELLYSKRYPRGRPRQRRAERDRHLGPVPAARTPPAGADRRAGAVRAEGHAEPMVRLPMLRGRRRRRDRRSRAKRACRRCSPPASRARPACICTGRCPTRCCAGSLTESRPAPTASACRRCRTAGCVLRIAAAAQGRSSVVTTGWVLEADRAVAVPLGSWTEGGCGVDGCAARWARRLRARR